MTGDVTTNQLLGLLKEKAERRWQSIEAKCHPAIFDFAQLYKETAEARNALGSNPPSELVAEIEGRFNAALIAIHIKHSGCTAPEPNRFAAQIIFSDVALNSVSDDYGKIEQFHWMRHGTSLKADVAKMQAEDFKASARIRRTWNDLEELRQGHDIRPFKNDLEHTNVFQILWGFGIEKLSPTELADFFDRYCPCEHDHDLKALKNQRKRFADLLVSNIPPDNSRMI